MQKTNAQKRAVPNKKELQKMLRAWFDANARDLPWRRTHNPYHILVSELMLQQTQVDRVIPKFIAFLDAFPDIHTLAVAPQSAVIAHWQGLGYNRRALYLHRSAQKIMTDFDGVFPKRIEDILSLPGVGPYTAGAIASFAFHSTEPIVDTNVERVIGRIFFGFKKMAALPEKEYWEKMRELLPDADHIWSFNQSLMDFGAMICTAQKPKCGECPFQATCASYPAIQSAAPAELRYKKKIVEPQFFGHPRRIWRGKILKALHAPNAINGLTTLALTKQIFNDVDKTKQQFISETAAMLARESFIVKNGQRYALSADFK